MGLQIGLVHDHVTCSKFTTKPRLRNVFSNLRGIRVVFTLVFLLLLLLWEVLHYNFKICILKPKLGGDFS